jgi:hypothetical protein
VNTETRTNRSLAMRNSSRVCRKRRNERRRAEGTVPKNASFVRRHGGLCVHCDKSRPADRQTGQVTILIRSRRENFPIRRSRRIGGVGSGAPRVVRRLRALDRAHPRAREQQLTPVPGPAVDRAAAHVSAFVCPRG